MSYIMALSKLTKNVLTASNPNDFIFHSGYNTFKIIAEPTYSPTLAVSVTETYTSVAHGQSFTPFIFCFIKFADNRIAGVGNKAATVDFRFTKLVINSTYILFYYINNTGGNYSPVFKYYITEIPL